VESARQIAEAVRASGVRAMVAHTLRFDATVAAVRGHIPAIAPLHAITLSQRFEPPALPWLDRLVESGGGVMLHTGIHSVDLLRLLSGHEVVEVSCVTTRVVTRDTEDNFVMAARLDAEGMLGQLSGSRAVGGRTGVIELAGARGLIVADHVHRVAWSIRGSERTPIAIPPPMPTVREALRAFVAGVRTGAALPVTIDDGVRAVAIVDAGYRSAATAGAPVAVAWT
jgi:myo-inositol 2-dehydrogenase/D-chiro-inositol 1-dehydrogenase